MPSIFKQIKRTAQKVTGKANKRLTHWQDKLETARGSYNPDIQLMEERDELFNGTRVIDSNVNNKNTVTKQANVVRNIIFELLETQVNSMIPSPKVDTSFQNKEPLASVIEESIKSDINRLNFEEMNDIQERTVLIQGGSYYLVEWDNSIRTHTTVGDLKITELHPKQVIPQPGVNNIDEMDYIFVQLTQTVDYIKRRYGVDVEGETEEVPDLESSEPRGLTEDLVTQNIVYYRNDDGSIGVFSWINDNVLEDLEDCQARRLDVCAECGKTRPINGEACECGSKKFESRNLDYEELDEDIVLSDGTILPAMSPVLDEDGNEVMGIVNDIDGMPMLDPMTGEVVQTPKLEKTKIPYYKPNIFPIVIRKNVSRFGKVLGDSDVDKIRDQQNIIKKVGTKVEEKILTSGSFIAINRKYQKGAILNDRECKVLFVDPGDYRPVAAINLQPEIDKDMNVLDYAYQSARDTLGITDSFQGRRDPTALSGVAKQYSAQQSAGRLESKRKMKDYAYSKLYEIMFKFKLAYMDEPRPFVSKNLRGETVYKTFNRYDFVERDDAGEYFYNDMFLFSIDSSAAVVSDRNYMQEQARLNLQSGAYGDPTDINTLITFWQTMESLHYPFASNTLAQLEAERQRQEKFEQAKQETVMELAKKGISMGPAPQKPTQVFNAPQQGGS